MAFILTNLFLTKKSRIFYLKYFNYPELNQLAVAISTNLFINYTASELSDLVFLVKIRFFRMAYIFCIAAVHFRSKARFFSILRVNVAVGKILIDFCLTVYAFWFTVFLLGILV